MALVFYNTAARAKQIFKSLTPGKVSFYTCGPTVYAPVHIGNLRTFVMSDICCRVLKWNDYEVKSVMNVTDVDDKTIKGSVLADLTLSQFTNQYEEYFFNDLKHLNIEIPSVIPHATKYLPAMIEMIEVLLKRGIAYRATDGIYFRIASFPNYGSFARLLPLHNIEAKSRINSDMYDKESAADFALWKFETKDAPVAWEASFGRGRPGWHIECSAMIRATLGETIDIHLGGADLIFPHHENEIAQSESVTGAPLARFWLHSAFVNMSENKMSKSLGNIITLNNLLEKNVSPLAYRYLIFTAHYRSLLNFTWESLTAAANAYHKLCQRVVELSIAEYDSHDSQNQPLQPYLDQFTEAINDDLNLPVALSLVWRLLDNRSSLPAKQVLATILEFDKILGLDLVVVAKPSVIPTEVSELLAERELARERNDFFRADLLRQKIKAKGYDIEDIPSGSRLIKISKIS